VKDEKLKRRKKAAVVYSKALFWHLVGRNQEKREKLQTGAVMVYSKTTEA
jgi:hypothetical protein